MGMGAGEIANRIRSVLVRRPPLPNPGKCPKKKPPNRPPWRWPWRPQSTSTILTQDQVTQDQHGVGSWREKSICRVRKDPKAS